MGEERERKRESNFSCGVELKSFQGESEECAV